MRSTCVCSCRYQIRRVALLFLAWVTSLTAVAQSDPGFFEGKEDGWFWYEKEPEEPADEPEQELEPQQASVPAGPPPMSVEWLREQLPVLRDRAIDNPTAHNVIAYKLGERIMMDKAQTYSEMSRAVLSIEPLLDENLRIPFASAAKTAVLRSGSEARDRLIRRLSEEAGLWVFYEQSCTYCVAQLGPIEKFVEKFGFITKLITKDGVFLESISSDIEVVSQTGQFASLNVDFTPTIALVKPPDSVYVVSQGFVSVDALESRMIAAAHRYGLITDKEMNEVDPTRNGILDPSVITPDEIDWENTEEWVPYLREQLRETYGLEGSDQ